MAKGTPSKPKRTLKELMAFFAPLRKERGSKYGDFADDMDVVSCIMGLLGAWYLKCNPKLKSKLPPMWWPPVFMVVMKLVRLCTGRYHEDNAVDGAHYLGQAATMQEQEAEVEINHEP